MGLAGPIIGNHADPRERTNRVKGFDHERNPNNASRGIDIHSAAAIGTSADSRRLPMCFLQGPPGQAPAMGHAGRLPWDEIRLDGAFPGIGGAVVNRIDVAGAVILLAGAAFLIFAWSSILILAMP
jgi:hypothetical protein